MIGIAFGQMVVRHLHSDQQRQQNQTQQRDRTESSMLPTAIPARLGLPCNQNNQPLLKEYTDLDAAASGRFQFMP